MSALGQKRTSELVQSMSALPPIADISRRNCHVRFVPKADIRTAAHYDWGKSASTAERLRGHNADYDSVSIATDIIEICDYSTNNVLALLSDWPFSHWARSVCDKANQARGLYRDLSRPAHYY